MDLIARGFIISGRSFENVTLPADEHCMVETVFMEASTSVVTEWKFPPLEQSSQQHSTSEFGSGTRFTEVVLGGGEILSGAVHFNLVAGLL